MPRALPPIVSAQVLVSGNGGADRVERVRAAWKAAGFDVGPTVGGTFSIAAPPSRFAAVFATRLVAEDDGGVRAGKDRALPLGGLPKALGGGVTLVTFGRPPSFGPRR
jgi:hypothetical protein